jgi:hypothetical protein
MALVQKDDRGKREGAVTGYEALLSAFDAAADADTGAAREEFRDLRNAARAGISRGLDLAREGREDEGREVAAGVIVWAFDKAAPRIHAAAPDDRGARAAFESLAAVVAETGDIRAFVLSRRDI